MKSLIDIKKYRYINNMVWGENNDIILISSYNNNYYFSKQLNDVILEQCNDDNFFMYYRINYITGEKYHIGNYISDDGFGIFLVDADIVELHDDIW